MSDRDDLRLNELQRYRKTSSRLALEVHSHCEVPAGCGGVVLRWRRPGAPVGISLLSYVSGSLEGGVGGSTHQGLFMGLEVGLRPWGRMGT